MMMKMMMIVMMKMMMIVMMSMRIFPLSHHDLLLSPM
jgi:hypothetical protein